ncbi:hypothetical protein [Novosphingobium ginsenosidimutans]|uniref:hypothetical protein n=1 Tax=Novosphingobium ginsenosidimutans TaxID=1176536 RepID=UPI001375BB75|nr:hypothetical protein [Novosphingobium ginsenosidimutans]
MTAKQRKGRKVESDEDRKKLATTIVLPSTRHGLAIHTVTKSVLGDTAMDFMDCADALIERAKGIGAGDPEKIGRMLAMQATTLDAIFTEMVRRMALNMGEYLGATQAYAGIALKAQAGSRAALAEIIKLHQPREQTVRHVHVNEGGQAVIADQFHNHNGGAENGRPSEQPHAKCAPGPALPGPHPIGPTVPSPGIEGQTAVPDARRQRKRRS